MTPGQPMPVDQARSILLQVGEALTYLHGKGILHRDLKPENILMPTDSLVKVGDFGIAVMQDEAGVLTQSARGMGTVGYVSPEQQYGLKVDERTDQYSLAALSYELLTGRRPLGLFPPPSRSNPRAVPRAGRGRSCADCRRSPRTGSPASREFVTALDRALARRRRQGPRAVPGAGGSIAVLLALPGWHGSWASGRSRASRARAARASPDAASRIRPATNPVPPPTANEPRTSPQAKAPERSPEFNRLVELRAYTIWDRSGRPTGPAGEAVKEKNWLEAERQIRDEVKARAYQIWEKQGRPTGAAGEAVREKNMRAAEAELLKETEDGAASPPDSTSLELLLPVRGDSSVESPKRGSTHGS